MRGVIEFWSKSTVAPCDGATVDREHQAASLVAELLRPKAVVAILRSQSPKPDHRRRTPRAAASVVTGPLVVQAALDLLDVFRESGKRH